MSDRVRTRLALLLTEGLPERLRNRAALVLAVLALVFGTLFLAHRVDIGVTVAEDDSGLVISWVEYGGLAWQAGARAGMRVYDLNNVSEPTQPVPPRDIYELSWIAQEGTGEHGEEEALAGSISQGLFQWRLGSALPGPILAAVILAAAGWWLTGPRSRGSHLAPLLLPAAAATAVP
ncbi:MAG: hypothetical protein H0V12_03675, partial [Chloroflexi bacterium]|nr:hypothetical protein [Chloroflexota bacterium]